VIVHVYVLHKCVSHVRWNTFRTLSNRLKCVSLCLEVTEDLPSDAEVDRWYGEPIKCVMLPTSIFICNRKGYPVLSAAHQKFLFKFFKVSELYVVFFSPAKTKCWYSDTALILPCTMLLLLVVVCCY